MKIVCPNCQYEFDTNNSPPYQIQMCPKCGAPYLQDGLAIAWAK